MNPRIKYLIPFIFVLIGTLLTIKISDASPLPGFIDASYFTFIFGIIAFLLLVKIIFPNTKFLEKLINWITHQI